MNSIPYGKQSINEQDISAVTEVLRSDRLTQGPKVQEFEQALARKCGARYCVAVANGTLALYLACLVLDVQPGDKGLTSPLSFMASANCMAYCGASPGFVDIDPDRLCLSPEQVERYCRENKPPRVVIPVDFAGIPADLPRFRQLADEYGFSLIEDAAHSIGSTYIYRGGIYGCASCEHTDMAILSFHPVKSVTSGEGGAVLTNDDALAHKLRRLSNHGIERDPSAMAAAEANLEKTAENGRLPAWYHEMQDLGQNMRLTDIHCALGLSQLSRLEHFKARRQEIVRTYNRALSPLQDQNKVLLPPWPEEASPCQHLYPLRVGPESRASRDQLFEALRERGIYCQVHYMPIYRQPYYREHFYHNPEDFPQAESFFQSALSLPLYVDLQDNQIDYIVATVQSIV